MKKRKKKKHKSGEYLELGPIHAHVDAVVGRPPLEVLVVVRVVDRVVQLLVDLRQPATSNSKLVKCVTIASK